MIGLVLAAGAGRRLRPYTDSLPKALVPVGPDGRQDGPTVLDLSLRNFAEIGSPRSRSSSATARKPCTSGRRSWRRSTG